MSAGGNEHEPLRETLSVEEGHNARRVDRFEDEFDERPAMNVLEIANKYAGLAVCVSAAIVAICAISGVAMIGGVHARMTPEAVAGAAAHKLFGGSALGDHSNLSLVSKHTGLDILANIMKVNWSPMFEKMASAWRSTADVYEEAAKNLAANPTELQENEMSEIMFYVLTEIAASMRTASEAVHMLGTIEPPAAGTEVPVAELAKDATMLDTLFGMNPVEDADGDATFPLAMSLQNMLSPESILNLAEACVQFADRVHPSSWAMHSYATSDVGPRSTCLRPETKDVWSDLFTNPLTGESLMDGLPFGGGTSSYAAVAAYDCSTFGNTPLCMCSQAMSFQAEMSEFVNIKETCQKLATVLSSSLAH